jgi:hypothetical protein
MPQAGDRSPFRGMRERDVVPNVGDMGAYHGWGLGMATRASIRRQRATRRALTLVVESTRNAGKHAVEPRATGFARRPKRLSS